MIDTNHLIEQLPYPGLFITLILGSLGLPLPEEATLLFCGYLMSKGTILPIPGIPVVYTGVLASDFIIFTLGRLYGRRLLRHRFFRRVLSPDRLLYLEDRFTKIAPFLIIFGRHILGLRAKIIFMSSIMGMSPLRFLLIDSIAASISVAVMVSIGYFGGSWIQRSTIENLSSAYPIAIISVVLVFVFILIRYIASCKKKHVEKETCIPKAPDHSMIDL
jgi:membrane protein DedA with SNARE-associated domain